MALVQPVRKKAWRSSVGATCRPRAAQRAFTLLEVLLALALSGILIGVLAMAIRTQLRASDSGRADVAQAQVARALLNRIADDVRAAVWYEPIDPNAMVVPPSSSSLSGAGSSGSGGPSMTGVASSGGGGSGSGNSGGSGGGGGRSGGAPSSGGGSSTGSIGGATGTTTTGTTSTTGSTTTTTTATTATTTTGTTTASGAAGTSGGSSTGGGSGGSGGGSARGGGGGGGGGRGGSSGSASVTTTQNLAQAAMLYPAPIMPMFIGGPNWMHVDVSRLPRTDQVMMGASMQGMPTGGSIATADMKTISYWMAGAANMPQVLATQLADGSKGQGLLRSESPRAASAAASTSATMTQNSSNTSLPEALAPEVAAITFEYSNGGGFQSAWDSRQQYSLPKAVRISVTFLADKMDPSPDDAQAINDPGKTVTYRLIVAPAAWRPIPAWMQANLGYQNSASGYPNSATGSQNMSMPR